MSHFPGNGVTYDWLFSAWRIFHPANAHSAQRSLACVALGKMSQNFKWIRGFFTQAMISLRAGRKITEIHYNVFESSHNSQNKNNLRRNCTALFLIWTSDSLMFFCDEEGRGQGREGTGDNYCFIDQKLMKKEGLWITHLITPCIICI